MKQIQLDTVVLLFLSWFLYQSQVVANPTGSQIPELVTAGAESPSDPKKMEINRLQQDITANKAEIILIQEQNKELHSKMKGLESRILELREKLLEESKPVDDSEKR